MRLFRNKLKNEKGVTLIELLVVLGLFSGFTSAFGVNADQMEKVLQDITQREDVVIFVSIGEDAPADVPADIIEAGQVSKVGLSLPGQSDDVVIFVSINDLKRKIDEVTFTLDGKDGVDAKVKTYVKTAGASHGVVIFVSLTELNKIIDVGDLPGGIIDVGDLPDGIIDVGDLPDGIIDVGDLPDGIIDVGDLPDGITLR